MLIKLTRIKKPKFSKNEFLMTKMLLDSLYVEYEPDFSITIDSAPIYCGEKEFNFPEHYSYINDFSKDRLIFRPLKNERHANILIEMFEESEMSLNFDRIEINEYLNDNNKRRFKGYMIYKNEQIPNTNVKGSPSIAILKSTIIAKALLSKKEYIKFKELLTNYLMEQKESNSNA